MAHEGMNPIIVAVMDCDVCGAKKGEKCRRECGCGDRVDTFYAEAPFLPRFLVHLQTEEALKDSQTYQDSLRADPNYIEGVGLPGILSQEELLAIQEIPTHMHYEPGEIYRNKHTLRACSIKDVLVQHGRVIIVLKDGSRWFQKKFEKNWEMVGSQEPDSG